MSSPPQTDPTRSTALFVASVNDSLPLPVPAPICMRISLRTVRPRNRHRNSRRNRSLGSSPNSHEKYETQRRSRPRAGNYPSPSQSPPFWASSESRVYIFSYDDTRAKSLEYNKSGLLLTARCKILFRVHIGSPHEKYLLNSVSILASS